MLGQALNSGGTHLGITEPGPPCSDDIELANSFLRWGEKKSVALMLPLHFWLLGHLVRSSTMKLIPCHIMNIAGAQIMSLGTHALEVTTFPW